MSKAIEADEGLQQAVRVAFLLLVLFFPREGRTAADADGGLQLLKSLESTVASDTCKIKSLPLHASADCFCPSPFLPLLLSLLLTRPPRRRLHPRPHRPQLPGR